MSLLKVSTILKWVTGGLEAVWAIPIIGGTVIVSLAWTPLVVMLALHIITLIFSINEKRRIHGSVLGIITSVVGWIPVVGWIMHIITAVFLMIDAYQTNKRDQIVVKEM
ncbi:hypothetical protein [Virgibacillus sp. YIM 98842]|uniref:hypothetical protein n=1 Tax=Virgibacillus sp. YIM 98842 TaxID=2663533 RepID=UPI003204ACF6